MIDHEWTADQKLTLLTCSLERVLNNALWLAGKALNSKNAQVSERAGLLIDALEGIHCIKEIADALWRIEQEKLRNTK